MAAAIFVCAFSYNNWRATAYAYKRPTLRGWGFIVTDIKSFPSTFLFSPSLLNPLFFPKFLLFSLFSLTLPLLSL